LSNRVCGTPVAGCSVLPTFLILARAQAHFGLICTVVHYFGCDGLNWRYCNAMIKVIQAIEMENVGFARTLLHENVFIKAPQQRQT